MTPCAHHDSGCNSPESDCVGLCQKRPLRYFPKQRVDIELPIQFAEPEPSRLVSAWGAFNVYRKAGHGLRKAFAKALAVYRCKF